MEAAAPAPSPPPIPPPLVYPESLDSSPRSRNTDSWDDPSTLASLSSGPSAKLRLMCSYGGHIVPRPHDKSLCYLGGDTRIVVVDRATLSLSSLSSKLSSTLLDGRSFTLKYQLPNEDLDSLISVTTDEDLDNMIDEYDRTMAAAATTPKSSRLRLFLFPTKPDSASSIGSLLDDSKSETWFVDALNGSGILPRGLSAGSADSADVNCLLGLDDSSGGAGGGVAAPDVKVRHPDSLTLETASSSFGSSSSAHFLSNLPPIRVHVDDGSVRLQDPKVGLEEQFGQMSLGSGGAVVSAASVTGAPATTISPPNEAPNRVFSDDERVEQGVPVANRKPPQPPQLQQQQLLQQKPDTVEPLPDTVTRDNSNIPGVISRPKPVFYQDPVVPAAQDRAAVTGTTVSSVPGPKWDVSDPNYKVPIQVQDPSFVLPPMQAEQQQFIHATPHYIHHHAAGPVPITSYYQMHPMHQPQAHLQPPQQQQQHRIDPQYQMYFLPVGQNQPYNLALQSNLVDGSAIPSSNPPPPLANPTVIPSSYKESQPVYPARTAPPAKPELAPNLYRTAAAVAPQPLPSAAAPLIHMPEQQQQYMGYHQMHQPSQPPAAAANFTYEYADFLHTQLYYTQPPATTLSPQYQTVSSGAISDTTVPSPPAEAKQNRTSQPL